MKGIIVATAIWMMVPCFMIIRHNHIEHDRRAEEMETWRESMAWAITGVVERVCAWE